MPTNDAVQYDTRPDVERFEDAMAFALQRIGDNLDTFVDTFPAPSGEGTLTFDEVDAMGGWTASFWTGQCWLATEYLAETPAAGPEDVTAGDCREVATGHLDHFERRLTEGDVLTHDLGFVYTLGALADYDVTGDEHARQIALRAAELLADRYHEEPGIIQAWGDHRNPEGEGNKDQYGYGRIIVDTMMNLPLLYRAAEQMGYDRYREIAAEHARQTAEYAVRDDGSTYHTFKFDVETGEPIEGTTHQGYADESCWSRGQAWTVYGFPLSYRYTGEEEFLDAGRTVADYFLDQLPEDHVPRWDFDAPDEARDTSAGSIAAAGLLELASHLPRADPDRERYENAALSILDSLASDYTTEGETSNGILRGGVYHHEDAVDEVTAWGDYFYVEALVRATRDWQPYW